MRITAEPLESYCDMVSYDSKLCGAEHSQQTHNSLHAIQDGPREKDHHAYRGEGSISPQRVWDQCRFSRPFSKFHPSPECRNHGNCYTKQGEVFRTSNGSWIIRNVSVDNVSLCIGLHRRGKIGMISRENIGYNSQAGTRKYNPYPVNFHSKSAKCKGFSRLVFRQFEKVDQSQDKGCPCAKIVAKSPSKG